MASVPNRVGVLLILVMLVASACAADDPADATEEPALASESPGEGASGSPGEGGEEIGELEQTTVTVSYSTFANNIIANRLPEFAADYGLTIEPLLLRTGPDLLSSILEGSADATVLTYTYVLQAMDQGEDVVAFSSNMQGGTRIILNDDLGIEEGDWDALIALAEERSAAGDPLVLVSGSLTVNHALGVLTLEDNGLDWRELLQHEDVVDTSLHAQLLQSEAADIGIIGEPAAALTVVEGWATTFAYPYETELGPLNTEWLAMRDWVEQNPNTVRALTAAIADTQAYFTENPDEQVQAAVDFTGIEEAVAEEAMANYTAESGLDPDIAVAAARIFFEAGLVQEDHSDEVEDHVITDPGG